MKPVWIVRGLLIIAALAILAYQAFEEVDAPSPPVAQQDSSRADKKARAQETRPFDFYVLSLSWSPSYCSEAGDRADPQQCKPGTGHRFIVHGLWPQYEKGYPEFCPTGQPQFVGKGIETSMFDIMPSRGLIRHQWKKHGTCTGLDQRQFFALTRKSRETVAIPSQYRSLDSPMRVSPAAMEQAFIRANPGLSEDAIAISCGRRHIREVRICLTTEMTYRACEEVDRKGCRLKSALLPAPK